jgi:hypothetical protein
MRRKVPPPSDNGFFRITSIAKKIQREPPHQYQGKSSNRKRNNNIYPQAIITRFPNLIENMQ